MDLAAQVMVLVCCIFTCAASLASCILALTVYRLSRTLCGEWLAKMYGMEKIIMGMIQHGGYKGAIFLPQNESKKS